MFSVLIDQRLTVSAFEINVFLVVLFHSGNARNRKCVFFKSIKSENECIVFFVSSGHK